MKTKNILKNILFSVVVILASYGITNAGNLYPGNTIEPTFKTLGDIYNKLIDNTTTTPSHTLTSSATPTSTFYTLTEIYDKIPNLVASNILDTASYMGVTGTIQTRTIASTTAVISAGYYAATNLTTIDTDLSSGNILLGVSIFGVTGTSSPSKPLKTGQTLCYDASGATGGAIPCTGTTGQDGEYQKGQAMSYTTTTNTVLDNSTGLMWKRCSEGLSGNNCETGTATIHTFAQAISICEADTTDGYTDWRLPNIKELLSIVDYGKVDPVIDITIFPETVSGKYWSSTNYFDYPSSAWYVRFGDGYTSDGGKVSESYVRCTR